MATLTEAITATQRVIVVTTPGSAAPGLRFRLDDELLELSGFDAGPGRRERAKAGTTNTRWVVNRGVGESTAASHDAGTTLMAAVSASISSETLTPPAPFAGEGGGGVEVNSTPVTNIVAPGAVIVGDEATLGKWEVTTEEGTTADLSREATANGDDDAIATTRATTVGGGAADIRMYATSVDSGATADVTIISTDGQSSASRNVASTNSRAIADTIVEGGWHSRANTNVNAASTGTANVENVATTTGTGLATANLRAVNGARSAGVVVLADTTSARMGFYNATPVVKPTGVAVTAEAIHAALVSLGLIEA